MAILPDLVRRTQADHLTHRIAHLHFKLFTSTHHPHICITNLTQQVQGAARFLA